MTTATPQVTWLRAVVRVHLQEPGPRWVDHGVSWLPGGGWWCDCAAGGRCRSIGVVRAALAETP